MTQEFKVAKRNTEPLVFRFEGSDREYQFTVPKAARSVLGMMDADPGDMFSITRTNRDWFIRGLGDEQWAHVEARLLDESDDLDWEHVDAAIDWANEQIAGRPTG